MKKRGLRVFGVAWHTPHNYSLANLDFIETYDLIVEPWRGGFATTQRPLPDKVKYVTDFTPNYYDFALLHIDQQSIYEPGTGNSISKGRLYEELKGIVQELDPNLPIVVINHMTPFHDYYESDVVVSRIKELTKGTQMVCNSYEAQRQWGWGTTITHGLEPSDWGYDVQHFKLKGEKRVPQKEPRCTIVLSPGGLEKAYRREFLTTTLKYLEDYGVPYVWVGADSRYKFKDWDSYRDFMSRSLLFFFPAWQSPRPRARTEAQLSGSCIVTTPYQDANTMFNSGGFKQKVENGKVIEEHLEYDDKTDGFLTSLAKEFDPRTIGNPVYTADLIRHLIIDEPEVALEIGKRGRERAEKEMNHHTFEEQWINFLKDKGIWKEY